MFVPKTLQTGFWIATAAVDAYVMHYLHLVTLLFRCVRVCVCVAFVLLFPER